MECTLFLILAACIFAWVYTEMQPPKPIHMNWDKFRPVLKHQQDEDTEDAPTRMA